MPQDIRYASYLLRIWREGDDLERWQGELESIQSGQRWRFARPESMIGFLQTQISAASLNRPAQKNE
jgi:hypothetical protein